MNTIAPTLQIGRRAAASFREIIAIDSEAGCFGWILFSFPSDKPLPGRSRSRCSCRGRLRCTPPGEGSRQSPVSGNPRGLF